MEKEKYSPPPEMEAAHPGAQTSRPADGDAFVAHVDTIHAPRGDDADAGTEQEWQRWCTTPPRPFGAFVADAVAGELHQRGMSVHRLSKETGIARDTLAALPDRVHPATKVTDRLSTYFGWERDAQGRHLSILWHCYQESQHRAAVQLRMTGAVREDDQQIIEMFETFFADADLAAIVARLEENTKREHPARGEEDRPGSDHDVPLS